MYSKSVVISVVLSVCLMVFQGNSVVANHNGQMVVCPKICTCDMVEGLRRAECSLGNLINTYSDVPTGVEILDLSINKISAVEDDDFKDYILLVKLFLSDNSIETISLNAFKTLRNLESLDLSFNRLEQLHEDLFEHNEKLTDLNLSNNNFMSLQNRPLLNSPSIMHLHLSDCKIPQLYSSLFIHLPGLRTLDLSSNLMITLPKEPFNHLKKLRSIDLHENQWKCDSTSVRATVNWMKKRIGTIQIENCFINPYKSKSQFEKMEMDPNYRNEKDNKEDVAIDKVWGATTTEDYWSALKGETCAFNEVQDPESRRTCYKFIECQKQFSELYHKMNSRKFNDRLAATLLICGIFVGVLFGSFTTYSLVYLARKCRKSSPIEDLPRRKTMQELRREFRNQNNFEHTRLDESPAPNRANRQTISNLSHQEQSQIYHNHENTRQFLINLFAKRQPRFVRNNSQIANLQNRYLPPTPIRNSSQNVSPAPTSSSFVWEPANQNQENDERERMLMNRDDSRESSALSVWNHYYGMSNDIPGVVPVYEVVPLPESATDESGAVARETPPPPYADFAIRPYES